MGQGNRRQASEQEQLQLPCVFEHSLSLLLGGTPSSLPDTGQVVVEGNGGHDSGATSTRLDLPLDRAARDAETSISSYGQDELKPRALVTILGHPEVASLRFNNLSHLF